LEVDRESLLDRNLNQLSWCSSLQQVDQGSYLVNVILKNEGKPCCSGMNMYVYTL